MDVYGHKDLSFFRVWFGLLFPLCDKLDLGTQRKTSKNPTLGKYQVASDTELYVMKDRQTTAVSAYMAAADWCTLSSPN